MIENNMYDMFESPVSIGEHTYGVIVNNDGKHGKIYRGDADGENVQMHDFTIASNPLEPDISRDLIQTWEPADAELINTWNPVNNAYAVIEIASLMSDGKATKLLNDLHIMLDNVLANA